MHDLSPSELLIAINTFFRLDKLSETSVLLLGILVGLVAKNLYGVVMRAFGFVGSFASRLAVGWWEEFRRETPNVMDVAMAVVADCEGRHVLLMDALIGPRRLNDIYLNPRTAFGVRMQTFSITEARPWVAFKPRRQRSLAERAVHFYHRAVRDRAVRTVGLDGLSPRQRQMLRYRRVYEPIENLVGQYLTNHWAAQMAIGEPCHVFRFIVALVYEKAADPHVDRHFHALIIWEELLRRTDLDAVITFHPEDRHRWTTIQRIGDHFRSSPDAADEFGSVHVMIPKRSLLNTYDIHWVTGHAAASIPISRPAADSHGTDARRAEDPGRIVAAARISPEI